MVQCLSPGGLNGDAGDTLAPFGPQAEAQNPNLPAQPRRGRGALGWDVLGPLSPDSLERAVVDF